MLLEAGKLDRLISLEVAHKDQATGSGEVTRVWAPLARVWANVAPGGGSESLKADQPAATQGLVFTIRYRDDVSPAEDLRIIYQGQPFDVTNVDELGRREGLRVTAYARAEVAVA